MNAEEGDIKGALPRKAIPRIQMQGCALDSQVGTERVLCAPSNASRMHRALKAHLLWGHVSVIISTLREPARAGREAKMLQVLLIRPAMLQVSSPVCMCIGWK